MKGLVGASELGQVLLGPRHAPAGVAGWQVEEADSAGLTAHRDLRREAFVTEQGLFTDVAAEADAVDDDPRAVVLVARITHGPDAGAVVGGVRLGPAGAGIAGAAPNEPDLGWWAGSRLVVAPAARRSGGVGPALVRAACARAEASGVLRFEATVQVAHEPLFARLGWRRVRATTVAGASHVLMRWPIGRIQALVEATKAPLGALLAGLDAASTGMSAALGGAGFVGDDAAPVPGSDIVAACDAIVPSMVERDPEWAGWCAVLANLNDLAAMGASPVGLLDAVAARDASFAARVISGLQRAARAYGVPVLGGHTQLGVPAALTVTALGRAAHPVPAGGGRAGMAVSLTADTAGAWRRGYTGRQWDSTTSRTPQELRAMIDTIATTRPAAAKDVSMAGIAGTLGMLAEASGCGAVLDVAAVPRPGAAGRPSTTSVSMGDWLTCFPGSAWLSADAPGRAVAVPDVAGFTSAACGELTPGSGVVLRWPDGEVTPAVTGGATGLGAAGAGSATTGGTA